MLTELARAWEKQVAHTDEWSYLSPHDVAAITALVSGASLAAAREREAWLVAMVERLREAIGLIRDRARPLGLDRGDSVTFYMAEGALSLTPPAALEDFRRREREAALLEAANLIRQTTPDATDDEFSKGKYDGRIYAIEQIESMADAIAAERGQENK